VKEHPVPGTFFVLHPGSVSDDVMITTNQIASGRSVSVDDHGEELTRLLAVWNGALHEFRNHLTVLLATATEVRSVIPPSLALEVADAVAETDRNVQSMSSLIVQLDAALKSGEHFISDLDEVIERALRLAAPLLGRRVSVSVSKGRKSGVKNRGMALEALLSTLLVDLARAVEVKAGDRTRGVEIEVHVEVGRGSLVIELESSGGRPQPGSWRLQLATALAAKIDATVTANAEAAGYVVQFR
jgi:hypothetical protein